MKFTLDSRDDINLIRGYAPGEVRIGEQVLHTPCIVAAHQLIAQWPACGAATLAPEDLAPIFELQPDVVLLGTGTRQTFPPGAVRQAFAARNVGLEVMDLGAACRTYNILVQEERRVVAALFPAG
ncbi:MAG TPA: Mth938-like domain-containing protein [Steroidobacteraceae bacterium]|nr:Mth938-like domain-containing protein [Steroidobacteraceae bacterium]